MTDQPARTFYANRALTLHDIFAQVFENKRFGGTVLRVARLQALDTDSTGGGKQARMGIALEPESGQQSAAGTLTCGWLDVGQRMAKLRSYPTVAGMYEQHFKKPLDMPDSEYDAFVADIQSFMEANEIRFSLSEDARVPQRQVSVSTPASAHSQLNVTVVIAAFLLGLLAGFVLGKI